MRWFVVAVCAVLVPLRAVAGPAEQCARLRNDDTVRGYDPSLKAGLLRAYAQLFPQARMPPDDHAFQAGAHIRCMNGRLLACFTGANLPCAKMNAAPDNRGADAFCQANPDAPVVPAFAAGHDAAYAYRCVGGRAENTGETFPLDTRGFAASLWAPVD
jgi:hypothetical protein